MKSMDPSNFGSFSSGGNSGATGNAGVPNGGVTPGTNPAANPQQVNPVQTQGFGGAQQMDQVSQSTSVFQQPQPSQFQPQTVAPNTGDIVLGGGTKPKKFKKGLVLAIIIFLIIITGGLTAYFLTRNNANNNAVSVQTLASNYREAFNEYANYILYGKDSLEDIAGTYESGVFYSIWQAADEEDAGFFNKSKVLFDNIAIQLQKQENEMDFVFFDNYSDIFNFYYLYNTVPRISSMSILEKYLQDGKESTSEYINDSYKVFDESSGLAQVYSRNQKEADLLTLDQINVAYSNGCIEGNTINKSCFSSLGTEFAEQKADFVRNVNSITYDASRDVVLDCFIISDKIYNLGKGQDA